MRILLIKLGALGDVLRTTALLPALARRYRGAEIGWLTAAAASPLLDGNPYLDFVLTSGAEATRTLSGSAFDWVLSLEEDPACAALQNTISAGRWTGVVEGSEGLGYTDDSIPYYGMSLLCRESDGGRLAADRRKAANRRSFEDIWRGILDLPAGSDGPQLMLSDSERERARAEMRKLGLGGKKPLLGINPGAGGRWPAKRIPEAAVLALAQRWKSQRGVPALLLGGPDEADRHADLTKTSCGSLVNAGSRHGLRAFAALVERLDFLATADSLALHVANAVGTPVAAAFGPTSSYEISLGTGAKLTPSGGCRCFYRPVCSEARHCLDEISAADWTAAIESLNGLRVAV